MDQPVRLQMEIVIPPEAIITFRRMLPSNDESQRQRIDSSQRAIYGAQGPPEDESLLVDSREAAKMLKCSDRTLFNLHNQGEMPKPIRIGRAVRWNRAELTAWVDAGCPPASEWSWQRSDSQ